MIVSKGKNIHTCQEIKKKIPKCEKEMDDEDNWLNIYFGSIMN